MSEALPGRLAAPKFLDRRTPPTLFTLVLVAGLPALAMTIFLPSMPKIAAEFDADYAIVQLAVSAYLALTGLLQVLFGPLADRFGRRSVLLLAGGFFLLATLGAMMATSVEMFLTCRFAQAVIASGIALSRTIVRDMVPGSEAASRIGYVTMGMALVPMVGPAIGGYLDTAFGWRASFALLLIFGLFVYAMIIFDLGETNGSNPTSFRDQVREYPILLRSRRFWGYALVAAFASGAFFSFLGGAPYVAETVLNMEPDRLGLFFGIVAFGYLIGNFFTGRFSGHIGPLRMMLFGTIVATSGTLIALGFHFAGIVGPIYLFGPMFFVGCGNGMTLPCATAGTLSARPKIAGTAAGLGGALMIGGGSAWAAATGAMLGPETGALPLIAMMFLSSFLALLFALYTIRLERAAEVER